jgi:hypothetical protein
MPKRFDTPWMNEETLAAIILKRRLWKKYKYCRNQRNIERYEEAKRRSKYLVRGAKEEYERSIALKGILSTSCVIFSYPKLLSISVRTFIK